jgi:hypothetical protein
LPTTPAAPRDSLADAVAALHDGIRRQRRPLLVPPGLLSRDHKRRWAAEVLTAEVEHAEDDFWHAVHRLHGGAVFDHYKRQEEAAPFRLPHEVVAATALNYLGHLHSRERSIRQAMRETRPPADPAYLRGLRGRWIDVARPLVEALRAYRALRLALETPLEKAA